MAPFSAGRARVAVTTSSPAANQPSQAGACGDPANNTEPTSRATGVASATSRPTMATSAGELTPRRARATPRPAASQMPPGR